MCLSAWNCFYNPYVLAYNPELSYTTLALVINTIIDFIFMIDIALNFRTSFFSSITGDEIIDASMIAKNYIMGKFWIDLLSCVPSDLLGFAYEENLETIDVGSILFLFGLMKVYRISRLNRIITFMRTKNDLKSVIRIG